MNAPRRSQPTGLSVSHTMLLRRLESIASLSEEDRRALAALPIQESNFEADRDIVREHDHPSRSFVLVEGFVYAYKVTGDGKRQITGLYLAGDFPDLQSLHLTIMDNGLATMTPCKLGFVKHVDIRALCERHHRVAFALWRATLIDASIAREWMTNIGQRNAPARMAHLLCEIVLRLKAVGLVRDDLTCELPITQKEFADALGFSVVHVNRTLQELRTAGLISLTDNRLHVREWAKLVMVGDFDATFLHIKGQEAVVSGSE